MMVISKEKQNPVRQARQGNLSSDAALTERSQRISLGSLPIPRFHDSVNCALGIGIWGHIIGILFWLFLEGKLFILLAFLLFGV